MSDIIPIERIEMKIFVIRGQRVMIDADLAEVYGVSTKRLGHLLSEHLGSTLDI